MTEPIVLSARDVCAGYSPTEPVIEHADVASTSGEVLMILGGSGSGKSTLLRSLSGMLPPLAGTVELLGEDVYRLDRDARARLLRRTGMVFQRDALFGSLTLRDNVALPVRETSALPDRLANEVAQRKLDLMDIGHLAHRHPSDVSGGQRKRAALARAIVLDPELLFCDEHTAGLDPITASHIDALLLRLRDLFGLTIVAVTHDVDSVRSSADRAIVVGDGHILAMGSPEELADSDDPRIRGFFHRAELHERTTAHEGDGAWQPQHRRSDSVYS
jgi:phospholipid/cholesterol/gamma-HCH transport system ATP-binding protein